MTDTCDKEEKKKDNRKSLREMGEMVVDSMLSKMPEDVAKHLCNSKKELLMAMKSFIDDELKRTDERSTKIKEKKSEK